MSNKVTFVYNNNIESYKAHFASLPIEVKVFATFALFVSVVGICMPLYKPLYAILPFTGSIGGILYLNPLIITIFNNPKQKRRFPLQVGIIALLALFMCFGIDDLRPDSYSLHASSPYARISPYRYLFTMIVPAIWIVVLAIRPIVTFQHRKSKHQDLLAA